ncbi:hypothetical protein FRC17_008270 [Serendipita sp. 399]|nr:hypothetical protein FRC17_008270 [Serendipita sp. 399]
MESGSCRGSSTQQDHAQPEIDSESQEFISSVDTLSPRPVRPTIPVISPSEGVLAEFVSPPAEQSHTRNEIVENRSPTPPWLLNELLDHATVADYGLPHAGDDPENEKDERNDGGANEDEAEEEFEEFFDPYDLEIYLGYDFERDVPFLSILVSSQVLFSIAIPGDFVPSEVAIHAAIVDMLRQYIAGTL